MSSHDVSPSRPLTRDGRTARIRSEQELRDASAQGNVDEVQRLLSAGGVDLDASDERGWSALFLCMDPASEAQLRVARLLLENGATVDARDCKG